MKTIRASEPSGESGGQDLRARNETASSACPYCGVIGCPIEGEHYVVPAQVVRVVKARPRIDRSFEREWLESGEYAAQQREERWRTAALLKVRTRRAIGQRVAAGESVTDLAQEYGVPVAFVERISQPGYDVLSGEEENA